MPTIGFLGAGSIGQTLAKAALACGYEVVISNSRGPETLTELVAELGPGARATSSADAAQAGDFAVVAVQPTQIASLPVEALAGKVVIDTGNYYPHRDGRIPELDEESTTVSELLQAHLPTSKVVKAFNHIFVDHLAIDGRPAGTPGRRALAIAGDDAAARKVVSDFVDAIGFDCVDVGSLAEGWRFQRDTAAYLYRLDVDELKAKLAEARRYRDLAPGEMDEINAAALKYLGF